MSFLIQNRIRLILKSLFSLQPSHWLFGGSSITIYLNLCNHEFILEHIRISVSLSSRIKRDCIFFNLHHHKITASFVNSDFLAMYVYLSLSKSKEMKSGELILNSAVFFTENRSHSYELYLLRTQFCSYRLSIHDYTLT